MAINESQLALLKIQLKRATTSEWNRSTDTGGAWSGYILRQAELGIEVFSDNTTKIKIGNGTSKWSQLPYVAGESGFFVNSLPDASRAIKNNFYIQGDKIYYTSNNVDWVEIGDTSNINFNTLTNRPKYAGSTMRNTTNIPRVPTTASEINYVNGSSGLSTTDVQGAIDEIVGRMANLYTRPIGNNIIFGNNSTGAATTYPLSSSKTASTIAQRTTSGTIKAVDPIENDDASTKLYVDNKVDPLTTKVNTLETNVASYNTKITNLETRTTNLEVDNTTNKNRLTTLEGQVDTNTGNITSLNSRLGTTNINISQLSTQVGNIQTQLDNLDIDTIETMITDESAIREANDITSMEAGAGTDNNQIKLTKGDGSTITGTIPLVTNSSNGLITYSDYQQIIANRDAIQDLQNQSGGYIGISFATKAALDAYVIPATIRKGQSTFVIDDETHNGATTKYYYDGTSFVYAYIIESDPVGIATTDQAGIVLSKNEAGKIYVESNGVMSLVGYDNLVTTINSKPNFSDLEGITDNNYTDIDKGKVRIITTDGTGNQFLGNDGLYHTITIPETGMINDITVDGNSIVDPITKEVELNKIVLSGSYNDLINVPSNLVQDSSYVHTDNNFDNTYKSKVNLIVTNGTGRSVLSNDGTYKQLSNVAFSGSYNDLTNVPTNLVQDANYVHTDNNLTDELVELIGQSSGEINTIETISLNGNQILPDAQRNVDIDLSLYALASSVPQNISDLNNDIDMVSDANYVHTDNNLTNDLLNKVNGIAAGAQVNTLETISLNGINIPITNKNVNISLANYATTDNLTTTTNTLRGEIRDRLRREIVTDLPTGDNIDQNTIYLKLADDPDTNNNYVEWININGNWEILGGSGSTLTAGNGITINNKVINSNNSNLVNGSATGSLRSIESTEESTTYTIGRSAVSLGNTTEASGMYAFAEGFMSKASGMCSHAEGWGSNATGDYSHSENISTATGECSHAEGKGTNATGSQAHAEGNNTKASGNNSHVQGKYNIEDTQNRYAHIVGNGTNNSNRSNAHTLDWDGNAWYQGDVYVGGMNQDTGSSKLIPASQLPDFQYRDLDGVLDENNLLDYIKSKYDQSCSGIASVKYYGQPGNDVMYAVYYYQNGYLTYEPIGIYKYHAPSNNEVVWIDGDTRNYENGNITNLVAGTNSVVTVSDVYTTNLSSIVIQYNGGGRFPEYHDVTTTYTMSGTTATCTCNGTNLSNYDSIRAKLTYSDGSTAYTDDYVSGGGAVACFTKDTQVETENGFKSISKIEVGDKVYSYNFETEEIELKEVDKVVKHEIKEITNIYTDNEILETTWSHPFYVVLKGSRLAKDLKVKDQLRMKNNMLTKINMIAISELKNKRMVYEIRVKDNHNYFVGNTGVLVFNETSVLDNEE